MIVHLVNLPPAERNRIARILALAIARAASKDPVVASRLTAAQRQFLAGVVDAALADLRAGTAPPYQLGDPRNVWIDVDPTPGRRAHLTSLAAEVVDLPALDAEISTLDARLAGLAAQRAALPDPRARCRALLDAGAPLADVAAAAMEDGAIGPGIDGQYEAAESQRAALVDLRARLTE